MNQNLKVYENAQVGVFIKYPASWEVGNSNNVIFNIYRPSLNVNEFSESINLIIVDNLHDLKLNQYVEGSLKVLPKYLKEYKLIKIEYVTYNNIPFSKVIYQHSTGGIPLTVTFYQMIKNGKGYNLTCTCKNEDYNKYASLFEEMVKSFKVD